MKRYIVVKDGRVFLISASSVEGAVEGIGDFLPPEHNKIVQFVGELSRDVYDHVAYGNATELAKESL